MLKRTGLAFSFAAALAATAPHAPAATAPADPGSAPAPAAPALADSGAGPAWGVFFSSMRTHIGRDGEQYQRASYADPIWGAIASVSCTLTPVGMGLGLAPGVVFGLACGLTGVA